MNRMNIIIKMTKDILAHVNEYDYVTAEWVKNYMNDTFPEVTKTLTEDQVMKKCQTVEALNDIDDEYTRAGSMALQIISEFWINE